MKDINLFKTRDSIFLKKIKAKSELIDDDSDGYLIESSEKEARKIIQSLKDKNKTIAIIGGDDVFNRRVIETLKINYLVSPERGDKKNSLKQRDSGINHVVAKLAKEKNITIVINMSEIINLKKEEKTLRLEKLIQNIKICRKAKCNLKIASLANNKKDILDERARKSFGISLGMSSLQSSESVKF